MLLTIDIGNTNISFGIFDGKRLKYQFDLATKSYKKAQLLKKINSYPEISDSIICSVVPKLTLVLQRDLKLALGKNPYIIGKDLTVPIENRYRLPKQVGQDRLVNAYAGLILYGAPLIIIDSGTAITFDVISKGKAYLGGLILPGLGISLAALNEKTALLPQIKLRYPHELIGRDTISSILSGVVIGAGALVDALSGRIKHKIGENTQVIGTGGSMGLIKKYSTLKIKIDRDLTLKGLNLIYKNKINPSTPS